MGFNDWIYIEPAPMAIDNRMDEVDTLAKQDLARELQIRLRGRVDTGIDLRAAQHAQAIRVVSEGDRLVIDRHSQAAVLTGESAGGQAPDRSVTIEQLFSPSTGVPHVERRPDGTQRLVFRSVLASEMFGVQEQESQDKLVEQAATDTLRTSIVKAYEDAVRLVENRYPAETL